MATEKQAEEPAVPHAHDAYPGIATAGANGQIANTAAEAHRLFLRKIISFCSFAPRPPTVFTTARPYQERVEVPADGMCIGIVSRSAASKSILPPSAAFAVAADAEAAS